MEYKRCNRCVMDNESDNTIVFDENGFCNYCTNMLSEKDKIYFPNEIGKAKLNNLIDMIKEEGQNKEFDCIMGISGGLDSSYLAYLGYNLGLRILAVHIDDGYDTQISKSNIEKLTKATGLNLKTIYPDQHQYDALTHAYMKAGVPGLAIPQDNILLAFLHDTAHKYGLKYFLSGGNFALEFILQRGNGYNSMDLVNIKDINKRFGNEKIDKLKFMTSYKKYLSMKTGRLVEYRPLNYIDYNRDRAFKELNDFCGFEYYGGKHQENIFTSFLQLYWLPKKFKVDKRKSHLSSMIISGQISRENALEELKRPLYDETLMSEYIEIIKKRLNISDEEFRAIMDADTRQHEDFKTDRVAMLIRKMLK
ncbi:MAG: N-acetyl sugar amidotransferase [Clostridiales bacterium]|nr:N-acetyl sugar amidotransferase [Clostridiales bacterium]MDY6117233.1 N-acetyl sugar amidotransferase [Anaerovoracaceae bacterium]